MKYLSFAHLMSKKLQRLIFVSLCLLAASASATVLTWDPLSNNGGPGSGNWDITSGNTNWWNGAYDTNWWQINTTTCTNSAIFNGPDGAYSVTNDAGQISVSNLFINASGYAFYGNVLDVNSASGMFLAPGKTVTFNCNMGTDNNSKFYILSNGCTLILNGSIGGQPRIGGPANSDFILNGNANAGVLYINGPVYLTNNTPYTITGGASFFVGYNFSFLGNTYTTGSLTVGGAGTVTQNSGSFLLGRSGGSGTINLLNGGTINVGTTSARTLTLGNDNFGNEAGILNVYGGTLTVGASAVASPIALLAGGSGLGEVGLLNQTNGTIYAWDGITIGSASSTSYTGGSSIITNSGGYLYLGAQGILLQAHYPPTNICSFSGGVVGALQSWSTYEPITLATNNGNITFQCTDNNNNPYSITLSGPVSGTGGLNQTGVGTLTLNAAATYSGATVVNGNGSFISTSNLVVNASGSVVSIGPVTNAAWATLSYQPQGLGNFMTCAGFNQEANSWVDINFGNISPSAARAPIVVSGPLQMTAASTLSAITAAGYFNNGTYPLFSYSSFTGSLPSTFIYSGMGTPNYSVVLSNDATHKQIVMAVSGSPINAPLVWNGCSGVWDKTTPNWLKNGQPATYADGDDVSFNDDGCATQSVITLNITVQPKSVTFNNVTNSFAISGTGSIADYLAIGPTPLFVQGAGTVTLATSNSYTGGTALKAGQLNISNGGGTNGLTSAIGTGPLTIYAGTFIDNTSGSNIVLQPTNAVMWNGSFTYVGSSNSLNIGSGAVTMTNASVAVTVNSNNFIVGGIISDLSGGGSTVRTLVKSGGGTLMLMSDNTFSGGLDIQAGEIGFGSSGAAGSGTLTFDGPNIAIDNVSGGPLTLSGMSGFQWYNSYTYVGSTTNTLDLGTIQAGLQNAITVMVASNILEWDQNVGAGNLAVIKTGPGTLVLGGVATGGQNGNTMGLDAQAGVVEMARVAGYSIADWAGSHKGLIVESNALVIDDGNGVAQIGNGANIPVTLETGGILDLNGNSETVDSLTFNGGVLSNDNTNFTTSTLSITYPGGVITLEGATNQIDAAQNASLTLNATITGSGGFVMNGPGILSLEGTNTYTGETVIENGAIALDNGASISGSTNIFLAASGSALDLSQSTIYDTNNNPLMTLQNGQTLSGFGSVTGLVATAPGATLAPGSASTVGTVTVTGFSDDSNVLSGVTMMKLNKGGHTNDLLVIQQGGLVLGGTLALNNLSGTLAVGDSFTLFAAAGGISGAFASITPPSPGSGLGWNTNNLTVNGSIQVTVGPVIPSTPTNLTFSVANGNITISWPTNYEGWILQTNLNSLRVSSAWQDVPGSDANYQMTFPLHNPGVNNEYFRLRHP